MRPEVYVKKKVIIGLGVLVVFVVIALLAAPSFIDVNHYRPQIEAKLQDRLGRQVSLGPMRISLIPLAFRVENAVIAEDPAFGTGRPFAQIQTLFVRPELLPLLHRQVQIRSLQLDRPVVELVRNERGTWNFSSLMTGTQQPHEPGAFSLDRLQIYNGQVGMTDIQQHKSRAVYDHIDVLVSDFAAEKPFSMDVRAHLPGSGQEMIVLQGKMGPIQHEAPARTAFDGRLNLDGVSLSGLQRFVNIEELSDSDAVLTGSADVKSNNGTLASSGKFDVKNPRIHGVDIGYPIAMDYGIVSNLNDSTAVIQKANLRLGQTPVSFQGSIDAKPTPMQVDIKVQTPDASIAEAARLAAAFGTAFNAKSNVSGSLSLNVHAQGAVTRPALSGQVAARNLRISGGEFKEPVQVDAIELSLSPDTIRSNDFTARTGHTSVAAQFTLSDYVSDAPKVQAKINTGDADLQELLRIAHAYGISAVEGINGAGVITLNASASGPLKQTDQLTFEGSGGIRNASFDLPAVAKPVAIRKADLQFNGNGVNLDNLDVSVGQTTAHGNLVARNFSAPQVQFSLSANHVNVAEWEQLFKPAAVKTPGPSPNARGSNIPPATTTKAATATKQDSLISRATGTGTLTADTLVYDELTLNNVRATVTLDHGNITMKPVTANVFNGQLSGAAEVDTRTSPATYSVDSKLQGVDANQLLSSLSPVKQTLYGILAANADTHFNTAAGAHSILPSLSGKVSLNLKDGKIANVDLLHQLATIAQFQRTAKAVEPFTQLVQLAGDFDIRNGVARTNNVKAILDIGSLAADGIVDLAQQKLNLHLTAVLSQDYSQSVGGTGIGGFLNTALANNKGELVIPVLVTGTFQQPQFAPDLQKVAEMKLQNLVPGLNNPGDLTNSILGQVLRGKPGQPGQPTQPGQPAQPQEQKAPDQQQQPNPLNDVFDLFKNKNKGRQ
jgi:uncharacterized protein involved in outer membrane biogenesis